MDAKSASRAAVAWRQARSLAALVLFALACTDDARAPSKVATAPGTIGNFAEVSSSNFQQCANGNNGGENCKWINGVLNASKSLYHESDVIAQRFVIPNLVVGRTYKLVFDWGWEKAVNPGHMNYDFLAGWNSTLGNLAGVCFDLPSNPDYAGVCNTTTGEPLSGLATDVENIDNAIFTTNAPLGLSDELDDAIDRFKTVRGPNSVRMDILGGSFPASPFDPATYVVSGDNVTGRFTVRFTAAQATVMLLWGGHFADGRDYRLAVWDADKNGTGPETQGNLSGAAGQSGAPFHFTQQFITDLTSNVTVGIGSLSNNVQGSVLEPQPKAKIEIGPSAVNTVGEAHTFTVTVQEDLDDGLGYRAAAGEHVDVQLTAAGGAVASINTSLSTCDNGGANTDSNGQCTLVFTSNTAGTITAKASATVSVGGASVSISTENVGVNTTDSGEDAVKRFVNARISLSPLADSNNVAEDHVLTATVQQDDGLASGATGGDATTGWGPVSGVTVTFALANNTAGAVFKPVGTNTCLTNASGQCTVTITSTNPGGVDIDAAATATVSGEVIPVQTGTGTQSSADAHKDWLAGSVAWIKNDGAGARLAGATFQLCRTHTLNTSTAPHSYTDINPDVCVTVTDKTPANASTYSGLDEDGDAGEFKADSLVLGKYTVQETAAPTGYVILNANAVSAPDMTISPLLTNVTIATAFVNASPQARISVTPLTDVNEVNDAHVITALVEANDGLANGGGDGVNGYAPASGVTVTFTLNNNTASAAFVPSGTNTCVTAANGQCSVTINTSTAGVVEIHATATVTVQGINVPVATGPGVGTNAGDDARKRYVDAFITLSPSTAVNSVGETHTFTAVMTVIPSGATPVTIGVIAIAVSPTPGTLGTVSCAAQVGDTRTCTLTINSTTAQTFTANASGTASIGGVAVTRDTDPTTVTSAGPGGSGPATKRYVDAFITIGPNTETNNVGETHTFTAVATALPSGATPVTIPDFTISVSPAPSTPGTTSCTAQVGNTKTCTRTINSSTSGTFTANASATFSIGGESLTRDTDPATASIGAGPGGSGPATKIYVAPNLTITKTPDAPVPPASPAAGYLVSPGDSAIFTITIANTGDGPATNTVIKDTLPNSGLTWVERTDKTECAITTIVVSSVNRQLLTCTIASFAAAATFTVQVAALVPASYVQVPPSPAGTPLQIDGNLIDDGAGNDWANVGIVCQTAGCRIDDPSGQQDGSFGQGTSEDTPVPSVVDGGIPPEKSDLLRFYVAKERFTTYDYLYLAWERVQEPNGTTNMDFELNQDTTLSSNGVTPKRTAGDLLIKYDLAKGGDTPVLGFHRWVTAASAGGLTAAQACEATNKFPCWGKGQVLSNDVAGAINGTTVGEVVDPINPDAPRTLSLRTFGEARINLQASGIVQTGVCLSFGSAYLKSRSSDSFTAAIKDFIAPTPFDIDTCQDVLINNRAWVSASNFTPSGGTLGSGISDVGQIKVQAPTASLNIAPANQRLAWASLTEPLATSVTGRDEGSPFASREGRHLESSAASRRPEPIDLVAAASLIASPSRGVVPPRLYRRQHRT